nr:hypothetical protein [uncultured Oribacterium sp.]
MKKNMNRLATLALSGMMVLSTAAPVFAAGSINIDKGNPNLNKYFGADEANVGKSVAGGKLEALGNSVSFDKVIRVETGDNEMVDQPDVVWNYTVTGVQNGQKINDDGSATSAVSAPFQAGTTTISDGAQTMIVLAGSDSQIDTANSDLKAEFKANSFDLAGTEGSTLKDFKDGVKITFKPAAFGGPGVYRFVVTEGPVDGKNKNDVEAMKVEVDGVQKSYQTQRFLDVYVRMKEGSTTGEKEIYGYVLHSGDTQLTSNQSGNKHTGDKNSGFDGDKVKNGKKDTPQGYTRYTPRKLKVDKKISGMINKDNQFPFTVNLFHNAAGSTNFDNADLQVKVKLPGASVYTVKKVSEIPGLGAKLKDNQSLEIIGLPKTTTYNVKENNNTSLTIKSDVRFSEDVANPVADSVTPTSETVAPTHDSTARGGDKSLLLNNSHVAYHNHIDEITPTGVVLTVAPYAMMLAVAGSMGFMFFNRKKEEE